MGCCDSKPRNIKQTQIGDTMKSANTPKLNSKYEPRITYTGNNSLNSKYSLKTKNSSTSYGLAEQNTRAQSVYNKNIITQNEFKKMEKYYYNLITLMGGG